jgi:uncharacterized protein (TIGR03083 family)
MDDELTWQVIERERTALGGMLATLTPRQWEQPSLCAEWTVRDVAAHVIAWPATTLGQGLVAALRAGGHYNRMIRDEARRRAQRPTAEIVADFARLAGSRRHPPVVGCREGLIDILVHTQDIALPLGLRHDMPSDAARDSADRIWRMGFPFFARRRLAGLRLEATDADWAVGDGAAVQGPISALLLLVSGRPAGLEGLTGPGAPLLRKRTGVSC